MPPYLVLARKYRPASFGDVVGQDHVIRTLRNSIASGRVAHAFLFSGVRGVGKTTVARILAKALNCRGRDQADPNPCNQCTSCREITGGISVDVQEIDGASHTSVDNIRDINENIKYPPVSSHYKIIIIDEVHMISINAFNALLKTLEEPPPHAKFMFATTEPHKVPPTIHSRCQRFNFRTISTSDILEGLRRILEQERIEASDDALAIVAREAQGSFRDALSLLDQVIAFSTGPISADDVMLIVGVAGREAFGRLVDAVIRRDAAAALQVIHELFRQGYDPEQLAMDLVHFMRNVVVVSHVPSADRIEGMVDASSGELKDLERLAASSSTEDLHHLFEILLRSEPEIKRSSNPWIALEMALIRMAHAPDLVDLSQLVRRMEAPEDPQARPAAMSRPPAAPSASPPRRERSKKVAAEPPHPVSGPAEKQGFVITSITPLADGPADEVWSALTADITDARIDELLPTWLEHGRLISYSSTEAEIGFTKAFYRKQFEELFQNNANLRKIFEDYFGDARVRTLVLAERTPLATEKPYKAPEDGESDRTRALKQEAMDHPIVNTVRKQFVDSKIEEIKVLT